MGSVISGIVLYFTIDGKFIRSWGYKNGKILPTSSAKLIAQQVAPKTSGLRKLAITQDPITVHCYDYFIETYTNGVLTNSQYLYSECEVTGGGSGGGVPSDDNGGGGTSGPDLPPCQLPNLKAPSSLSGIPMDPIGTDPGDGGFPPPTIDCVDKNVKDNSQSIIINQVKDPCLYNVVQGTLDQDIKGEISEILYSLGESTAVKISIKDVASLADGADDALNGTFITENGVTKLDLTISLNLSNLHSSQRTASQEFVAGTIIHEAIHAYFRFKMGSDEKIDQMDHKTMSESYVAPMVTYLRSLYGMTNKEASSIVWRGLMSTNAYQNSTSFNLGVEGTASKAELQDMGVNYSLGIIGKKLCD